MAGLSAALAVPPGRTVLLATKDRLGHSATRYAQGGIAAVLDLVDDSVAEHVADTLAAGAGLCDPVAVRTLVEEGGQAIADLLARGVGFDSDPSGPRQLARTREGGHSRSRVVHAGGDATGAELERALTEAVRATPSVRSVEHAFLVDLVTTRRPGHRGAALVRRRAPTWSGPARSCWPAAAPASCSPTPPTRPCPPATGSPPPCEPERSWPTWSSSSSTRPPSTSTATPIHRGTTPAVPRTPPARSSPRPCAGEGAVLRDDDGSPVMAGVHPLGDLAPRDVVTRAVAARMAATGARHLWLDATGIPADHLERRFPTILARCRAAGIDPSRQPIPVSPAAHYLMGGVLTDLDGRTSLPGLFAVGEAACTGVHGANRLASNSLLEGVVFAARIGRALAEEPGAVGNAGARPARGRLCAHTGAAPAPGFGYAVRPTGGPATGGSGDGTAAGPGHGRGGGPAVVRERLRRVMTDRVGVVRSGEGLAEAMAELERLNVDLGDPGPEGFEAANLVQLGRAVAELAARREESRGGHWRSDHPAPVEAWRVRQTLTRSPDGGLDTGLLAVPTAEEALR